jgi:hypothetical protein
MRGPHPEYANETAWALVDLQRDGLIEKPHPKRLAYRIAASGGHAEARRERTGARTIVRKLTRAMNRQKLTPEDLAKRTGKQVGHVEAVLAGYPNATKRPTQLDTVEEIAAALGLKLDVTAK